MDADTQTLNPMPHGFHWKPRCHLDTLPTGLFVDGELVVSMVDRVDGTWLAYLHLEDGVEAPLVRRVCTSFENGRRGAEKWALRHEAALRAKAAAKLWRAKQNAARHTLLSAQPPSA